MSKVEVRTTEGRNWGIPPKSLFADITYLSSEETVKQIRDYCLRHGYIAIIERDDNCIFPGWIWHSLHHPEMDTVLKKDVAQKFESDDVGFTETDLEDQIADALEESGRVVRRQVACGAGIADIMSKEIQKRFDYAALDERKLDIVNKATEEIKRRVRRAGEDIVLIGQRLLEVKEELPHGQFTAWIDAEFGWTDRHARNFMAVAQKFKTEIISDLDILPTALYMLASPSTDDEVVEEVLERGRGGETVTPKVVEEVKAAKNPQIPDEIETDWIRRDLQDLIDIVDRSDLPEKLVARLAAWTKYDGHPRSVFQDFQRVISFLCKLPGAENLILIDVIEADVKRKLKTLPQTEKQLTIDGRTEPVEPASKVVEVEYQGEIYSRVMPDWFQPAIDDARSYLESDDGDVVDEAITRLDKTFKQISAIRDLPLKTYLNNAHYEARRPLMNRIREIIAAGSEKSDEDSAPKRTVEADDRPVRTGRLPAADDRPVRTGRLPAQESPVSILQQNFWRVVTAAEACVAECNRDTLMDGLIPLPFSALERFDRLIDKFIEIRDVWVEEREPDDEFDPNEKIQTELPF